MRKCGQLLFQVANKTNINLLIFVGYMICNRCWILCIVSAQEDEDDPFYMPMAPAAIKWADASKFTTLARPLGKMESPGGPFMIEMEPGMYEAMCSIAKFL